jgi:cysteine-rich repeat protein
MSMHEFLSQRFSLSGALCLAAVSCASEPTGSISRDQPIEYAVGLTIARTSSLPRCNTASNGTVAHVDSPSSLWSCTFGRWREIPCSLSSSGDVAYSNTTPALWACVKKEWTPISLPGGTTSATGPTGATGPIGPAGPAGTTGPTGPAGLSSLIRVTPEVAGSNCAEGGVRLETGVDDNADDVLDTSETDDTVYVCNGLTPAVCGNGQVERGEQCDSGATDTTTCDADCSIPACGDSHLNAAAGEECEDGNVVSGDGCSVICRIEPASCVESSRQCLGNGVQTCGADSTWGPTVACADTQSCAFGVCLDN